MATPHKVGRRFRSTWWRWALGGVLLLFLLLVVGPNQLWQTFRRASLPWVLAVLGSAALWLLAGGLNVWILLRRLTDVRLATFLGIYVTSWAAALLIPGQLGDATQILLLREHGVSSDQSGAAYVVDKVVSLTWMLVVATAGAALYLPLLGGRVWLFLLPLALVPCGLLALHLVRIMIRSRRGFLVHVREWIEQLTKQLRRFASFPGTLGLNFTLTVVKWLMMAGIYLAAFRAFGAFIPFAQASTIPVMSSLVGYIPITVGGAGTMEWTAVALFGRVGVEAAQVVSAFLLQRLVLLFVGAALVLSTGRAREADLRAARSQETEPSPASGSTAVELQTSQPGQPARPARGDDLS